MDTDQFTANASGSNGDHNLPENKVTVMDAMIKSLDERHR